MNHHSTQSRQSALSALVPQVREGLGQLLRAFDYARDLDCSAWDFSVEIERLLAQGMTTSDLRWLIKRGYLSQSQEITGPDDAERRFDTSRRNLAFSANSCFVLTDLGVTTFGRGSSAKDKAAVT